MANSKLKSFTFIGLGILSILTICWVAISFIFLVGIVLYKIFNLEFEIIDPYKSIILSLPIAVIVLGGITFIQEATK